MTRVAAVIVAAGSGERFGRADKVMVEIAGRPAIRWVLDAMEESGVISQIVIVAGSHTQEMLGEVAADLANDIRVDVVAGGSDRQSSMANGVRACEGADIVVVHDAARPLITPEDIRRVIGTANDDHGAILAAPVTDTIKRVRAGEIAETIDRRELWGAQTPQAFRAAHMQAICARVRAGEGSFTDEASIAEALGIPVAIVPASAPNPKLTHQDEVVVVDALMRQRLEHS